MCKAAPTSLCTIIYIFVRIACARDVSGDATHVGMK